MVMNLFIIHVNCIWVQFSSHRSVIENLVLKCYATCKVLYN